MVIKVFIIFGIYILIGICSAIIYERYCGGWIENEDEDILAWILFWPFIVILLILEFMIWIVKKAGGRGL